MSRLRVAALAALALLAFALYACAACAQPPTCTSNDDCGVRQACDDNGRCQNLPPLGGEGEGEGASEGEGEGGEGEGEGEGACSPAAATLTAPATGVIAITSATLAHDVANIAQCLDTEVPFVIIIGVDALEGHAWNGQFGADAVAVADVDGAPAHTACDRFPFGDTAGGDPCTGGETCFVGCPICYATVPTDLAVQLQDLAGDVTNAACVTLP